MNRTYLKHIFHLIMLADVAFVILYMGVQVSYSQFYGDYVGFYEPNKIVVAGEFVYMMILLLYVVGLFILRGRRLVKDMKRKRL